MEKADYYLFKGRYVQEYIIIFFLLLCTLGICNFACIAPTDSAVSNPLSASMMSPGNSFLKIPQLSVIRLSLAQPPHAS